GVQLDQLAGHLAGLLFDAAGGALPLSSADPADRRRSSLAADVALNPVDLVGWHVERIAAGVLDVEIVSLGAIDLPLHQPAVDADSVMDVDHEIVLPQVQDGRDRNPALGPPAGDDGAGRPEELRV